MPAHKHAALMAEYAKDAAENERPWTLWQCRGDTNEDWIEFSSNPLWQEDIEYRRKPQFVLINGYAVPKPEASPLQNGELYSSANLSYGWPSSEQFRWSSSFADKARLTSGLVHKTQDGALAHAIALLSFTKQK